MKDITMTDALKNKIIDLSGLNRTSLSPKPASYHHLCTFDQKCIVVEENEKGEKVAKIYDAKKVREHASISSEGKTKFDNEKYKLIIKGNNDYIEDLLLEVTAELPRLSADLKEFEVTLKERLENKATHKKSKSTEQTLKLNSEVTAKIIELPIEKGMELMLEKKLKPKYIVVTRQKISASNEDKLERRKVEIMNATAFKRAYGKDDLDKEEVQLILPAKAYYMQDLKKLVEDNIKDFHRNVETFKTLLKEKLLQQEKSLSSPYIDSSYTEKYPEIAEKILPIEGGHAPQLTSENDLEIKYIVLAQSREGRTLNIMDTTKFDESYSNGKLGAKNVLLIIPATKYHIKRLEALLMENLFADKEVRKVARAHGYPELTITQAFQLALEASSEGLSLEDKIDKLSSNCVPSTTLSKEEREGARNYDMSVEEAARKEIEEEEEEAGQEKYNAALEEGSKKLKESLEKTVANLRRGDSRPEVSAVAEQESHTPSSSQKHDRLLAMTRKKDEGKATTAAKINHEKILLEQVLPEMSGKEFQKSLKPIQKVMDRSPSQAEPEEGKEEKQDTLLKDVANGAKNILKEAECPRNPSEQPDSLPEGSEASTSSHIPSRKKEVRWVNQPHTAPLHNDALEPTEKASSTAALASASAHAAQQPPPQFEELVVEQSLAVTPTSLQSLTQEIDKHIKVLGKSYLYNAREKTKTLREITSKIKQINGSQDNQKAAITALFGLVTDSKNRSILSVYRGIAFFNKPVTRLWGGGEVTSKKLVDDLEAKLKNLSNELDVSTTPDSAPR